MKELLADVLQEGIGRSHNEWPDPSYAHVASAIADDRRELAKLERLCDDLESTLSLRPGPGSLVHLARTGRGPWEPLKGRCWREVITDASLGTLVWEGVKNLSRALKGRQMDSGTRRTGMILHAVAVKRLESLGLVEADTAKRKRHLSERQAVLAKPYLPKFIATVLEE